MLTVGLVMEPSGLVMIAVAPLSAKITAGWGPKWSMMLGALLTASAYGTGLFAMASVWQLLAVSSVIGAGIGIAYWAMPALVMGAVPAAETASANRLNTLMRSIGTSLSSAVAGLALAQLTTILDGRKVPSETAFQMVMAWGP